LLNQKPPRKRRLRTRHHQATRRSPGRDDRSEELIRGWVAGGGGVEEV